MIRARVSGAAVAVVLFRFGAAFAQDAAMVEKGKTVFTDQKCKMCHSIAGVGNPKGSLDDVGGQAHPGRDEAMADESEGDGRREDEGGALSPP